LIIFLLSSTNKKAMPTKLPTISSKTEQQHAGESMAIVDGNIVAFGKDSCEATRKALIQGFSEEDIMIGTLLGPGHYVF